MAQEVENVGEYKDVVETCSSCFGKHPGMNLRVLLMSNFSQKAKVLGHFVDAPSMD